jgi:DNA modification methylase
MTGIAATTPFRLLPTPVYTTRQGACYLGDAMDLLRLLPNDCIDLVVTSPPFALLRQKAYGNKEQSEYVGWLCRYGAEVRRVLRETGSFVLDLGGAYQRGVPVRSLYPYRILLKMCDEVGFLLGRRILLVQPGKTAIPY